MEFVKIYLKILLMNFLVGISVAYVGPLMIASYSTSMLVLGLLLIFVILPGVSYYIIRKY